MFTIKLAEFEIAMNKKPTANTGYKKQLYLQHD